MCAQGIIRLLIFPSLSSKEIVVLNPPRLKSSGSFFFLLFFVCLFLLLLLLLFSFLNKDAQTRPICESVHGIQRAGPLAGLQSLRKKILYLKGLKFVILFPFLVKK